MIGHEEKELIRKVITGFTPYEKYKLYKELGKDLDEEDVFEKMVKEHLQQKKVVKKSNKTPSRSVVDPENIQEG